MVTNKQSLQILLAGMLRDPSTLSDLTVTGISLDSRQLESGNLFLCLAKGGKQREQHLQQALNAAVAVVLFDAEYPLTERESQLIANTAIDAHPVKNLAEKAGEIAARYYGHPSMALTVIAVTGTNGKTSTSQFIAQALESLGLACGVIGTLGVGRVDGLTDTGMTTPDPVSIQKILTEFCDENIKYVVIEASSHALEQGRLNSVSIDVALFTNLSRDHLDYHNSMAEYGQAKERLFKFESIRTAIINSDDKFGSALYETLQARGKLDLLSYSSKSGKVNANFKADNVELKADGLHFDVVTELGVNKIQSSLFGRFNIDNLLATAACLTALNINFEATCLAISQCHAVKGRMDMLGGNKHVAVVIDFAHTPDALEQALRSLQEHITNNADLWCVFGCGGDRDVGKRPLMGVAAQHYANKVIITDDNPRSEDPQQIVEAILVGMKKQKSISIEHDRKLAITSAIKEAKANDIVLVAGKGHEQYQEVMGIKTPFSDYQIVMDALSEANNTSLAILEEK